MFFFQKILQTLDYTNKLKFFLISFLGILRAFTEIISIGLIIPILTLVSDNNGSEKIVRYLPILKILNLDKLNFNFLILFLLAYLIKTIFLIFFNIINSKALHKIYLSETI
jgi:hypothetical protein